MSWNAGAMPAARLSAGDPQPVLGAVDQDLTGLEVVGAGEGLDERGLAGPVLAHERVHLPREQPQVDVVEGAHTGEDDRDAEHLDHRPLFHGIHRRVHCDLRVRGGKSGAEARAPPHGEPTPAARTGNPMFRGRPRCRLVDVRRASAFPREAGSHRPRGAAVESRTMSLDWDLRALRDLMALDRRLEHVDGLDAEGPEVLADRRQRREEVTGRAGGRRSPTMLRSSGTRKPRSVRPCTIPERHLVVRREDRGVLGQVRDAVGEVVGEVGGPVADDDRAGSRMPHDLARAWNARSRARHRASRAARPHGGCRGARAQARWSTASVVPNCWSTETVRKLGSLSALMTSTGTPIVIFRSAATDDERGAMTQMASTPCPVR